MANCEGEKLQLVEEEDAGVENNTKINGMGKEGVKEQL